MACTPPSTCTISPVVMGNQSDNNATQALATAPGGRSRPEAGARGALAPGVFKGRETGD